MSNIYVSRLYYYKYLLSCNCKLSWNIYYDLVYHIVTSCSPSMLIICWQISSMLYLCCCSTPWDSNFWLDINYLHLAKAALHCSNYFSVLLYTEIHSLQRRFVETLYRSTNLISTVFTNHPALYEKTSESFFCMILCHRQYFVFIDQRLIWLIVLRLIRLFKTSGWMFIDRSVIRMQSTAVEWKDQLTQRTGLFDRCCPRQVLNIFIFYERNNHLPCWCNQLNKLNKLFCIPSIVDFYYRIKLYQHENSWNKVLTSSDLVLSATNQSSAQISLLQVWIYSVYNPIFFFS